MGVWVLCCGGGSWGLVGSRGGLSVVSASFSHILTLNLIIILLTSLYIGTYNIIKWSIPT